MEKRERGFMITIHIKLVFRVQGIYSLRKICFVKFWDCNSMISVIARIHTKLQNLSKHISYKDINSETLFLILSADEWCQVDFM